MASPPDMREQLHESRYKKKRCVCGRLVLEARMQCMCTYWVSSHRLVDRLFNMVNMVLLLGGMSKLQVFKPPAAHYRALHWH